MHSQDCSLSGKIPDFQWIPFLLLFQYKNKLPEKGGGGREEKDTFRGKRLSESIKSRMQLLSLVLFSVTANLL